MKCTISGILSSLWKKVFSEFFLSILIFCTYAWLQSLPFRKRSRFYYIPQLFVVTRRICYERLQFRLKKLNYLLNRFFTFAYQPHLDLIAFSVPSYFSTTFVWVSVYTDMSSSLKCLLEAFVSKPCFGVTIDSVVEGLTERFHFFCLWFAVF